MQIRILNGSSDDLNTAAYQFGMGVVCFEVGQYNAILDFYEEELQIRWEDIVTKHVDVIDGNYRVITLFSP